MTSLELSAQDTEDSATSPDASLNIELTNATARKAEAVSNKWFNYSAMRNVEGANRYRMELAVEMLKAQKATTQRSAREWEFLLDGRDGTHRRNHTPSIGFRVFA